MPNFDELLETHAGQALAGLILFQEAVGELPWQFETENGVLSFGDELRFDAQILATESFESATLQWAWANEASDLPEAVTQHARRLRAFGIEKELVEFTEPVLSLEKDGSLELILIAMGVTGSRAAFPAEHEHGVVHLLVPDPGEHVPPRAEPEFLAAVIGEMLEAVAIFQHRPAVRSLLESKGYSLSEADGGRLLVARSADGTLGLKFDGEDRLSEIETGPA